MAKYRSKKASCGLCKPHKKGWENKHKFKDQQNMDAAKKEISDSVKKIEESTVIDRHFFDDPFTEAKINNSLRIRELNSRLYEKTIYLAMTINQAIEIKNELEIQIAQNGFLGKSGAVDICLGGGAFIDNQKDEEL